MRPFPELPLENVQERNAALLDAVGALEDKVSALSDALETALLWIDLASSVADSDARAFINECRALLNE